MTMAPNATTRTKPIKREREQASFTPIVCFVIKPYEGLARPKLAQQRKKNAVIKKEIDYGKIPRGHEIGHERNTKDCYECGNERRNAKTSNTCNETLLHGYRARSLYSKFNLCLMSKRSYIDRKKELFLSVLFRKSVGRHLNMAMNHAPIGIDTPLSLAASRISWQ